MTALKAILNNHATASARLARAARMCDETIAAEEGRGITVADRQELDVAGREASEAVRALFAYRCASFDEAAERGKYIAGDDQLLALLAHRDLASIYCKSAGAA